MPASIKTFRSKGGEIIEFRSIASIELSIFNNKYRVSSEEFNDGNFIEITKEEYDKLEILKNKKFSLKLENLEGKSFNDILK